MENKSKVIKKLSLKRETLRNLLDSELAQAAGGYGCAESRVTRGCSTATVDKCATLGAQAKTLC